MTFKKHIRPVLFPNELTPQWQKRCWGMVTIGAGGNERNLYVLPLPEGWNMAPDLVKWNILQVFHNSSHAAGETVVILAYAELVFLKDSALVPTLKEHITREYIDRYAAEGLFLFVPPMCQGGWDWLRKGVDFLPDTPPQIFSHLDFVSASILGWDEHLAMEVWKPTEKNIASFLRRGRRDHVRTFEALRRIGG